MWLVHQPLVSLINLPGLTDSSAASVCPGFWKVSMSLETSQLQKSSFGEVGEKEDVFILRRTHWAS